jgi:hypothetical protein
MPRRSVLLEKHVDISGLEDPASIDGAMLIKDMAKLA